MSTKPILFNTEMVRAILDDKKTVTRRLVKNIAIHQEYIQESINGPYTRYELYEMHNGDENYDSYYGGPLEEGIERSQAVLDYSPCKIGDILYVRETWQEAYEMDGNDQIIDGTEKYYYAAGPSDVIPSFTYWVDPDTGEHKETMPWRPSLHMPKVAARIFLKVTDVRVERLQDMDGQDVLKEGVNSLVHPQADYFTGNQRDMFERLWDSMVDKSKIDLFGWNANPWVWVIDFEKVSKEDAEQLN